MEIAVKEYIEKMIPALSGRLYPVHTTDIVRQSVTYLFTPVSGGHLRQTQLELKVIDSDYDKCKEMEIKWKGLENENQDINYWCIRVYWDKFIGGHAFQRL